MRRFVGVAVVLTVLGLAAAPPAVLAHQGNPNMQSVIRAVQPSTPGLELQIVNRDDHFELVNATGKSVVIYGYNGEPYARVLADGTVEVNRRSPAYYLNQDRLGTATVPPTADPKAPPVWSVVDKAERFQWHDHRMHWMGKGVPPQVKDDAKRQKVFDYTIPIKVGGQKGKILGTLWWTPQDAGGPPTAAIVAFVLITLVLLAYVVLVRRRRARHGDHPQDPRSPGSSERPEAW